MREEGKTSESSVCGFTLTTRLSDSSNPNVNKRPISANARLKPRGWKRAKKKEDESRTEGGGRKTRRYAQKRDLSIVRSFVDDPMSGSHPRQFLQEDRFALKKRNKTESRGNRLRRRTREIILEGSVSDNYLQGEQLSRERKLSRLYLLLRQDDLRRRRRRRGGCEYVDVVVMTRGIVVIARETRKRKEHVDDLATATFRRASRCFRRETIVSCLRVRREDSEGG